MKNFNCFKNFLLVLSIFINASLAEDFRVLDHETVEMTNPHRVNAKLKITFVAGNITHINTLSKNSRTLVMDWDFKHPESIGQNYVRIHNNSFVANSTFYDFTWHHQSSSHNLVCFDLGFNNGTSWYSTALEKVQPWPYNTGNLFQATAHR